MKIKTKARGAAGAWMFVCACLANPMASIGQTDVDTPMLDLSSAHAKAQQSFDQFYAYAFGATNALTDTAAVKLSPSDSKGPIWVKLTVVDGDRLVGVSMERARAINRADIQDWSIAGPDGRLFGNFTTRLAQDTSPALQRTIEASLSMNPYPIIE